MNDSLKPYRKAYRAWKNKRQLEREGALYQREFACRGLVVPDAHVIARAVKARTPRLARVPRGSLRTLAIFHDYNWEATSLLPALGKYGEVVHYDWRERFDHGRKDWSKGLKAEMNRDLLEFARTRFREGPLDFIFTYLSGELVTPETVRDLSALGAPVVNLGLNDKEVFVGRIRGGLAMGVRDICRHFDLCWTSTHDALVKYCAEGAIPLYLPEGANPDLHRPHDVERTIDVSFVGQCYGNRPQIVVGLRKAGILVETFGPGWPNGPLSTTEMVQMYFRSRICLGFAGVAGNRDTYCLKGRDFEVPMSGGLYVTEHHEVLDRFFEVGKEIVTYAGLDDLIAKIRHVLAHSEEAEQIRLRGYERALREHTWEGHFGEILRLIGLIT
jgi:spore maturation protein CgeB